MNGNVVLTVPVPVQYLVLQVGPIETIKDVIFFIIKSYAVYQVPVPSTKYVCYVFIHCLSVPGTGTVRVQVHK